MSGFYINMINIYNDIYIAALAWSILKLLFLVQTSRELRNQSHGVSFWSSDVVIKLEFLLCSVIHLCTFLPRKLNLFLWYVKTVFDLVNVIVLATSYYFTRQIFRSIAFSRYGIVGMSGQKLIILVSLFLIKLNWPSDLKKKRISEIFFNVKRIKFWTFDNKRWYRRLKYCKVL